MTPLLVLGAGHRCGSTLVQRLLSSHPDVLIWGEHLGQLAPVLGAVGSIRHWSDNLGLRARGYFAERGYQSFMANLMPEATQVDEAMRAFLRVLFAEPAAAQGRPVWGLKEIRYTLADAVRLHALFPTLAVVYIVRDPRAILCSLDEWERSGGWWSGEETALAVTNWQRVAASFLPGAEPDPLPVLRLRYEDMVTDPFTVAERIGAHTGLDAGRFDMEVFATRITGGPPRDTPLRTWAELAPQRRALLETDEVIQVAQGYGYQLTA